jgi:hypothetical protein
LSNPQTFGRSAGKVTSPVIVMAMNASLPPGVVRSGTTLALARLGISDRCANSISQRAANIKTPAPVASENDQAQLAARLLFQAQTWRLRNISLDTTQPLSIP